MDPRCIPVAAASDLSPLANRVADFFRASPMATPLHAAQRFNRDMIDVVEAIEEIQRAANIQT